MNTYSESGDFGHIIYHLPIVRHMGGGNFHLFPAACTGNRMTREKADVLAPLLEVQPYIHRVTWGERPEGINLDKWREHYIDGLNLTDMACRAFNVPHPPREQPWLFVEQKKIARVIFHRSSRHHAWNFPWLRVYRAYKKEAVFVGLPEEHADFCHYVGPISYIHTENMLELAQLIRGAELFVGNQSAPYSIAEALKMPTILEIVRKPNNCHWDRKGIIHGWGSDFRIPELKELSERLIQSTIQRAHPDTLLPDVRLETIARCVRDTAHLPGDMAELGVYKGGAAQVIASMAPHKTLHLFDTFKGIPEDDKVVGGHKKGEFAADAEPVRKFLQGYKVTLNTGRFPETVGNVPAHTKFSFVHLDADIYQSTADGIKYFWEKLVPGGIMVFDDYGWQNCPGVEKAIKELLPNIKLEVGALQAWAAKPAIT